MSCCQSCAVGAQCEEACIAGHDGGLADMAAAWGGEHDEHGFPYVSPTLEHIGDNTGRDIGRTVAQVDRAIGDTIADIFRGSQFGFVSDIHDKRMEALERAAPEFYGQPAAPAPPPPPAPAAPAAVPLAPFLKGGSFSNLRLRAPLLRTAITFTPEQIRAGQEERLRFLESMAIRAAARDPEARSYFQEQKRQADAGSLIARRNLAAAIEFLPRGSRL